MKGEQRRIWQEATVIYCRHLVERLKKPRKISVNIAGILPEV
jgi:hypothetical protein